MSKSKKVDFESCRYDYEFERAILARGGELENGKGSHIKVHGPLGMAVIARRTHEIPKQIRAKIVKSLIAIGLVFVAVVWIGL